VSVGLKHYFSVLSVCEYLHFGGKGALYAK